MTESEQSEKTVREYFESRDGWTVKKLDSVGNGRNGQAADFRICNGAICFLCEVKTVESVRANFPSTPLDSYLEQRKKRQSEIKKWKDENPAGKQLILSPGEYEFIYGDEIEFEKKYRKRSRNTEDGFRKFAQSMKDYLSKSVIKDLPYNLRLDSDDLYTPNVTEKNKFFKWLEDEMQAINQRNFSWHWHIDKLPYSNAALYSTHYTIHAPANEDDVKAKYQLTIEGPLNMGGLEVNIHSYGGLNLEAITSRVMRGLEQLEESALREQDPLIPRIIVLDFASGIGLEWQELQTHIEWLLKNHSNLSAIVILDRMAVPSSPICHNSCLKDVKPFPAHIFSNKWAVQL
jgi:hypothetical protein